MTTQAHLVIALVTAHIIGDFVLQTKGMSQRKTNVRILVAHAMVVAALSYVLVGAWLAWEIPAVILVSHALIDFVKVRSKRDGLVAFTLDQLAHVVVVLALVYRLTAVPSVLYWVDRYGSDVSALFVIVAGAVTATKVAGVVIEKVIRPFQIQLSATPEDRGFLSGGETIGRLERFLIFVFILTGQPGSIGFLIAAKSILRFGELRDGHRKEAEYVIIGTMWSFACGLLAALATRAVLDRL